MADGVTKVLLIDDEEDVLKCFQDVFKNFKHIQLITARQARLGIEIAKQEMPKVILTDLRMPQMGGEEALRELKPLLPDTKFVVMTGWDDGVTKDRMLNEIGVDAYFEKPIDLEKVITKVISLVMVK